VWSYAMLNQMGQVYSPDEIVALASEALERAEAAGDVVGTIALRATYAGVVLMNQRTDEALVEGERALADARALAQPALTVMGLLTLGQALAATGEPQRGLAMVREGYELSNQINSDWQSMTGLSVLAALEALYGDAAQAAVNMRAVLESARETGEAHRELVALTSGLSVFNCYGRPDLVARADSQLAGNPGGMIFGSYSVWKNRAIEDARAALGDEGYDELAAEGASLPWGRFVEEIAAQLDTFIQQGQPAQHS